MKFEELEQRMYLLRTTNDWLWKRYNTVKEENRKLKALLEAQQKLTQDLIDRLCKEDK